MATKATPTQKLRAAELTPDGIVRGIDRLSKRTNELEALLRLDNLNELDRETSSLKKKIDETLSIIFGEETTEYFRYRVDGLYARAENMFRYDDPFEYVQEHHLAIRNAISTLSTAVSMLEERLDDLNVSPTYKAKRAIEGLEERAAGQLYRNGHYANAIEGAVKALNALVRLRSRVEEDGVSLMQRVFSPKNPVLKFNDLADESDRNEQQGFMQLFCGAVTGLRNPRAHKIINDDPEEAVEFLAFISLLAKLLDKAKKA